MDNKLIKKIFSFNSFAIAGSFRDKTKIAYQILIRLLTVGKKVYPLNPNLKVIEGIACYSSIKDIKEKIDIVVLVTPPEISLKIAQECKENGIKYIWAQPGASDEKLVKFCEENSIILIHDICMLMNLNVK